METETAKDTPIRDSGCSISAPMRFKTIRRRRFLDANQGENPEEWPPCLAHNNLKHNNRVKNKRKK